MKMPVSIAALLLLAACATAAPSPPASPVAPASPSRDERVERLAGMLAAAGGVRAPTQGEIETALGPADITRRDGAGAALTYRYESCALLLLFAADGANAMRLAEAHRNPRRGGAAPSVEQCAMEAAARRS